MNEPVANACRTCGRWPSLFELEGSTLDVEQRPDQEPPELYEPEAVETEYFEPEAYDVGEPVEVDDRGYEPVEYEGDVEGGERPKPLWQRLSSLIIPIGVVLYIVISAIVNNDGG